MIENPFNFESIGLPASATGNLLIPVEDAKICANCLGQLFDDVIKDNEETIKKRKAQNLVTHNINRSFGVFVYHRELVISLTFIYKTDGTLIFPQKNQAIKGMLNQMNSLNN